MRFCASHLSSPPFMAAFNRNAAGHSYTGRPLYMGTLSTEPSLMHTNSRLRGPDKLVLVSVGTGLSYYMSVRCSNSTHS